MNGSSSNPWIVQQAAAGGEPLPSRAYMATFASVEPFDRPEKGIVGKWLWTWKVVTPAQYVGRTATGLTDQQIDPHSKPGCDVRGMAGRELKPGEDVQALVQSFVGQTFLITYGPGPKGDADERVRDVQRQPNRSDEH